MLRLIPNSTVEEIQSGCCGMAGSYGYEREHYDISLKVGEDRLFPAVRAADEATILVASGISCRHQIADGTGRTVDPPDRLAGRGIGVAMKEQRYVDLANLSPGQSEPLSRRLDRLPAHTQHLIPA